MAGLLERTRRRAAETLCKGTEFPAHCLVRETSHVRQDRRIEDYGLIGNARTAALVSR
jgi:hypothetical protein